MDKTHIRLPLLAALIALTLGFSACSNMLDEDGSKKIPVTGVSLNKISTGIDVGSTEQLVATIEPANASDKEVTWESSDETVATVDAAGVVSALKAGSATVTATTVDGTFSADCDVTASWVTGNKVNYTADEITFAMVYVSGGYTFPTGVNDDGTATVDNAYWIAETEVTYELWYAVRTWARANGYTLNANPGREGNDGTITTGAGAVPTAADQEPVTTINWREAMVWCNALTEYYNAHNGTDSVLDYVYYTDSGYINPIRSANDSTTTTFTTPGSQDNPYVKTNAKGYRLLSSNEYEIAARYRGTDTTNIVSGIINSVDFPSMKTKWTKGNSASGATTYYNDITGAPDYTGKLANDIVAVYYQYWDGDSWELAGVTGTGIVKSKGSAGVNSLGLYDMSGNVWEWCFDSDGSYRVIRGGGWSLSADYLQVGFWSRTDPYVDIERGGFRFARSE